ncbi:MAG: DUF3344 domain-containing protein [Methanophagales archaeon]|nr:DUF3344 domain-containing protein [Methanophagales archaeon]
MKKIKYLQTSISVITLGITMLCLIIVSVAANYNFNGFPMETRASGTINGGVFVDGVPWAGTTTLTVDFEVPNGAVKWARLYTGIWGGNPTNTGWIDATFNGVGLGPLHLEGENECNPNVWCSGCGKYWMYFDVTDSVTMGSTNTATVSKINGSIDGRVYGIALVVVYEGGDNPKNIQYWINDGSDALHDHSYVCPECGERNEGTTSFGGAVDTGSITGAELTMIHLTGYDPSCNNCLEFNDNPLSTSMITHSTIDIHTWDVSGYVVSSGNLVWYGRGEDPFVNICNAILVLEKAALFDPWRYDINEDRTIEKSEVIGAIQDYFDGKITKEQVIEVIKLYYLPT